jgi:hypothetical protein
MVNIESNPLNGSSFMNDLRNKYMEKQTAVEWYFTEIWNAPKDKFIWHSILIKAKEMEKEQIIKSYEAGVWDVGCRNSDSEKYYNETFNTNEK